MRWALGTVVKTLLGMPAFCPGVPGFRSLLLADKHPEMQQATASQWRSKHKPALTQDAGAHRWRISQLSHWVEVWAPGFGLAPVLPALPQDRPGFKVFLILNKHIHDVKARVNRE